MLENDSNKQAKEYNKKNKYANQNLIPFSDYNISNENDIREMITKQEKIVKTLEREVLNLKQTARNKIN